MVANDFVRKTAERRLTEILILHWQSLRDGRTMPQMSDIDPDAETMQAIWSDCFLMKMTGTPDQPAYRFEHLGKNVRAILEKEGALDQRLANKITASYPNILHNFKPAMDESELADTQGSTLKYRQILLPLGEDNFITHILGGIRFKRFAVENTLSAKTTHPAVETNAMEAPIAVSPQDSPPLFQEEVSTDAANTVPRESHQPPKPMAHSVVTAPPEPPSENDTPAGNGQLNPSDLRVGAIPPEALRGGSSNSTLESPNDVTNAPLTVGAIPPEALRGGGGSATQSDFSGSSVSQPSQQNPSSDTNQPKQLGAEPTSNHFAASSSQNAIKPLGVLNESGKGGEHHIPSPSELRRRKQQESS